MNSAEYLAKLAAWEAKIKADRDEILRRLEKLEANPFGQPQREQPRAPLDPSTILDKLLVDPNLGEAVRQRVFQIKQGHIR